MMWLTFGLFLKWDNVCLTEIIPHVPEIPINESYLVALFYYCNIVLWQPWGACNTEIMQLEQTTQTVVHISGNTELPL